MPSCPTARPEASTTISEIHRPQRPDLLELLSGIDDFRDPRGRRHTLASVLALGMAAVIAGACSYVAIGEWAAAQDISLLTPLGIDETHGVPEVSTFRRVFSGVDADRLDAALGAHLWTRTYRDTTGRKVIALDGKTVRGARTLNQSAPHLLAACDHSTATILGQLAVDAKSNEIPAARTLLATFDLTDQGRGVVVTVDALHTQTDTADLIVEGGGDYVFTIKKNQPSLYRACTKLPWSEIPTHRLTERVCPWFG